MKPPRIFHRAIAALLLISPARAVTDTWDGGGTDDMFTTNGNWVDDTAPVSDANNTDLIFAGSRRTSPLIFFPPQAARLVTFDNTAAPFTIRGSEVGIGVGLFDFDPTRDLGKFTKHVVKDNGLLTPGLRFDFSRVHETGEVRVVPEPSSLGLCLTGSLLAGLGIRRRSR